MATSAWVERLRELVLMGPVSFARAQSEMARVVPPGRAFRDSQRYVDWGRTHRGAEPISNGEVTEERKDELVKRGQMKIAYVSIWTSQRSGRIEIFEQDGEKMLRLGPRGWPA